MLATLVGKVGGVTCFKINAVIGVRMLISASQSLDYTTYKDEGSTLGHRRRLYKLQRCKMNITVNDVRVLTHNLIHISALNIVFIYRMAMVIPMIFPENGQIVDFR